MATGLESGFRLGPWDVRPMLGTLSGPAGEVHLEPKVMGVLVCLAEQPGEVVTRDRFVARVWDGRIVTNEVLSRCISLLRTRLGDNPREPRIIQTVPKIGYRLIAPVQPLPVRPAPGAAEARATDAAPPHPPRAWWRITVPVTILLLAGAVFLLRDRTDGSSEIAHSSKEPSIAVLPFVDHSSDPADGRR